MKHLVLFESFNSDILGKTLSFIDKKSKDYFMRQLKLIGSCLDFPISEFSDDLFEYLPYNKALKKQPENKENDNFAKLIKFWFNKDGEFITLTGTNGTKIDSNFSNYKQDYKETVTGLKANDIKKLPTGSFLWASLSGRYCVCFLLKAGNEYYLLQNYDSGDYVDQREYLGEKVAKYSWVIINDNDINNLPASLLEPLKEEEQNNLYSYERIIEINFNIKKIELHESEEEKIIKSSDFAIILDLEKLEKKDFERVSKKQQKREELKKGSLSLKSNAEIKQLNIDRYMKELFDRFDLDKGTTNVSSVFTRGVGHNNSLFFILGNVNIDNFNYLVSDLIDFFNGDKGEFYSLRDRVDRIYKNSIIVNRNIKERESIANPLFERDEDKRKLEIYNEIKELSSLTHQILSRYSTDTLSDVFIYFEKIRTIKNLFDRFLNLRKTKPFIEYQTIKRYNPHEDISEIYDDKYDDILKECEEFKKMLKKI